MTDLKALLAVVGIVVFLWISRTANGPERCTQILIVLVLALLAWWIGKMLVAALSLPQALFLVLMFAVTFLVAWPIRSLLLPVVMRNHDGFYTSVGRYLENAGPQEPAGTVAAGSAVTGFLWGATAFGFHFWVLPFAIAALLTVPLVFFLDRMLGFGLRRRTS